MTLRSEIMERIRKMPIVSDLKSRRFFKDTTPETCHILEVFLSHILGEEIKVKNIEAQKHGYQRNGRERIADIDIDISGNISGMVEIQNWNGKVKELDFERRDASGTPRDTCMEGRNVTSLSLLHKEWKEQNLERIQGQGDDGLRNEERRLRRRNGQKSLSRYRQRYYHIVEPEEAGGERQRTWPDIP